MAHLLGQFQEVGDPADFLQDLVQLFVKAGDLGPASARLQRVPDLPSFMQYAVTGRHRAGCRHGQSPQAEAAAGNFPFRGARFPLPRER